MLLKCLMLDKWKMYFWTTHSSGPERCRITQRLLSGENSSEYEFCYWLWFVLPGVFPCCCCCLNQKFTFIVNVDTSSSTCCYVIFHVFRFPLILLFCQFFIYCCCRYMFIDCIYVISITSIVGTSVRVWCIIVLINLLLLLTVPDHVHCLLLLKMCFV